MARYQFEQETETPDLLARGSQLTQIIVRASGFVLLIVGLWIALAVIAEAWSLYRDPSQIERFATAIEQGSHLDQTLASASRGSSLESGAESPADIIENAQATPPALDVGPAPSFRLSYFVAWLIELMLLMLIGRLALAAVKTGGELVLHDRHIKRFVRELLREAGGKASG
ncbi:MAG: hypothetical protein EXR86_09540 [Gammaproteobacteria bacterium]|nr:hypothetical protein [Gammaproteobacteria bacterium]